MSTAATAKPNIGETLISARPLAEYRAMFDLSDDMLRSGRILDCPGGAASFGAEVRAMGAEVVSVDPMYAAPAAEMAARARADVVRGNEFVRANIERYVWSFFDGAAEHLAMRGAGCERFVADRARNPDPYVTAALADLPFADGAFTLALSSHLLFTYADRLSHDFHVSALRELVRVSPRQVRVYPLVDIAADPYPRMDRLRLDLEAHGVSSEIRVVPYEFQRGANRMMVLSAGT